MPLFYIFQCSFDEGVFSEKPKAAKITSIFTKHEPADLTNYRALSVLARISKILKNLMCNRLYNYLIKNIILCSKQFKFLAGHSTDDTIV